MTVLTIGRELERLAIDFVVANQEAIPKDRFRHGDDYDPDQDELVTVMAEEVGEGMEGSGNGIFNYTLRFGYRKNDEENEQGAADRFDKNFRELVDAVKCITASDLSETNAIATITGSVEDGPIQELDSGDFTRGREKLLINVMSGLNNGS